MFLKVNNWKRYVKGEPVANFWDWNSANPEHFESDCKSFIFSKSCSWDFRRQSQDMCSPGPITNDQLFEKEDPKKLRTNLRQCLFRKAMFFFLDRLQSPDRLKQHYIGVNACVWRSWLV